MKLFQTLILIWSLITTQIVFGASIFGELRSAKIENVGALPSANPATKGRVVLLTTDNKVYYDNGTALSGLGGISGWLTSTPYSVGDIVVSDNKFYQALTAHTSGTFLTDLVALKWKQVAPEYDGNMLVNPNFEEALGAEWVVSSGTIARTTTSGEYSEGNAALKITSSASGFRLYQTVATVSGAVSQHVVSVNYKWLSTDISDFQICTLINGNALANEQTCVPTANLIGDNVYHTIEIPTRATAGQTIGIVLKSSVSAATKNVYADKTYIKQGIGTQALQLDNVYSATINTSTHAVTQESKDFINGNCTAGVASGISVCTFNTGTFASAPNCTGSPSENANHVVAFNSAPTTSGFQVRTYLASSGGASPSLINIVCQKSGNDYLAASSAVYSQASANTDWTPCTFSTLAWQGLGTVVNTSLQCRRNMGMLEMKGSLTTGTVTASNIQILLPNNYGTLTTQTSDVDSYGLLLRSAASVSTVSNAMSTAGLGYFQVSGCLSGTSSNPTVAANGNTCWATSERIVLSNIRIPISGWSNSAQIVGSFVGYTPDTSIVNVSYSLSANSTVSGIVNYDNKVYDSCSPVCVTTGASWKFTAPVSGTYLIGGMIYYTTANNNLQMHKNNSATPTVFDCGYMANAAGSRGWVNCTAKLAAGDTLDFRTPSSLTVVGGAITTADSSRIEITRIAPY